MSEPSAEHSGPGMYEVRIQGHLAPRWAARFEGLTLNSQADGTTLLRGPVADQAALHGLLGKLRDLNLALLSVARVDRTHPDSRNT